MNSMLAKTKTAERIDLKPGNDNDERDYNVRAMGQGIAYVPLLFVSKLAGTTSEYSDMLKDGERFSSVEVYDTGALNLFIQDAAGRLIGFIRVR